VAVASNVARSCASWVRTEDSRCCTKLICEPSEEIKVFRWPTLADSPAARDCCADSSEFNVPRPGDDASDATGTTAASASRPTTAAATRA